MKKLMMMAAVAVVAIGAQASACKWTASNIYQPETTTALDGGAVWVFYSTDTSSASVAKTFAYATAQALVADLADSEKAAAALAALQAGAFKTNGKTTSTGQITIMDTRTNDKNWAVGNSVAGYAVIFDNADVSKATHVMITQNPAAQNFTGTNQTKTFTLGSQAETTWSDVASVPEPTSAMLLLLGVAGLALKRRRA